MSFILTDKTIFGLFYIQRYRYLSIRQFVYITGLKYDPASYALRKLADRKVLGSFGAVPNGSKKSQKCYFLTPKGHDLLLEKMEAHANEIGAYKKVKGADGLSALMNHNLKATDILLVLEKQIRRLEGYRLVKVFLDRRMEVLKDGRRRKETTDFIDDSGAPESKLIPDCAFILERLEDSRRFLFFVEYDNGSETIAPNVADNFKQSVQFKFSQYVKYLVSLNYRKKYSDYGDFRYFQMLFVTTSKRRASNVSQKMEFIDSSHRKFFYISNFDDVCEDFFFNTWLEPFGGISAARPIIK